MALKFKNILSAMKKMTSFAALLVALGSISGAAVAEAGTTPKVREYRPLMAKSVKIEVAGKVVTDPKAGIALTSKGWTHFDAKQWDAAIDKFLSALEKDSADHSAAEGLVMALYRSGDFAAAARLGAEISAIMPGVKEILARTVTAEVRYLVNREEREAAGKLLAHFPAADADYREAHGLLNGAAAIETALREGTDESGEPGTLAGN
jgi:tetratricopeptide (TPR) repeat protein